MLWAYKGLCQSLGLTFSIISESLRCKQALSWELYKESSSHTCIHSILIHVKLCFLVSSCNSDSFTSSSSDGEIVEDMDEDDLAMFQMMDGNDNFSNEFFLSHEMEEKTSQFVNPNVGVWDVPITMWATPTIFKTFTNFTMEEFDKLASLVVPTIITHAQSTCEFLIPFWE